MTYCKKCGATLQPGMKFCTKCGQPIDLQRLSGNLVGISINLCKSIQKELFIYDTP